MLTSAFESTADVPWSALGEDRVVRLDEPQHGLRTLSPEEHYRYLLEARPSLMARLRQREVALYLGLSEAGMSRIVKRVRAGTRAIS